MALLHLEISLQKRAVFFIEQKSEAFQRALSTVCTLWQCSTIDDSQIIVASKYIQWILPIRGQSALHIQCWWIDSTLQQPIGIMSHLYRLKEVNIAVSGTLLGCMHIWKNELVMLILPHTWPFTQLARMLSAQSRRKQLGTVLEFSYWQLMTICSRAARSALGIRKASNVWRLSKG